MRVKSVVILLVVVLVLGFGLLRIYGAYQNEQRKALFRATQAEESAALEQRRSDEDAAELDCSDAWHKYRMAKLDAEYTRIKIGELAYEKAELELLRLKPICDSDLSFDASTRVIMNRLEHDEAVLFLKARATAEKQYASDRKLQTRCIWHRAWAKVTGVAPETDDEWVRFLAQNCGGALGELVAGKKESGPDSH
jgi:hypothetical protein